MIRATLVFCFFLLTSGSLQSADSGPNTGFSQRLVSDVYQPHHVYFSKVSKEFALQSVGLCERPPASLTFKLQVGFTDLLEAYSVIEMFRIGPLLDQNRKNRLYYWPDKRRAGERQLRSLLNSGEIHTINAEMLADKSVTLQGFTSLERLLFSASLLPVEKTPQCHLITAVNQNIANMAGQLDVAWHSDSDFVSSLKNPSADSDYFRTHNEVVRSVYTQAKVGLDLLLNEKLASLLSSDQKRVKQSPMWLSQRTVAMLTGNIRGLEALILDSGLLYGTPHHEDLRVEFNYLRHVLDKLKPTFYLKDADGNIKPDVRIRLNQLAAAVAQIRYIIGIEVAFTLGISAGFNSEDGD